MLFLPFRKKNPKPNQNTNNKIYYETGCYDVSYALISYERFSFLSDGLQCITNSDLTMVMGRAYSDVILEECFSSSFYFV